MSQFPEYKSLDLVKIAEETLHFWKSNQIFQSSIDNRKGAQPFVFYEGPPSANGLPGIHHVMARTIKDIFCRYQTQLGKQVHRKAGWDTHGLPVELGVEKALGITKDDIGKSISIAEYNAACKKDVMKYTDIWNQLTEKMGYWVDMDHPYVTYDRDYMESVWWLLKRLYEKGFLYKGYSIQPYSPAAGTGLSSHELNQPGCYRMVKDQSAVVMFRLKQQSQDKLAVTAKLSHPPNTFLLAWTTTPWTLPSNTGLAVGASISYDLIETRHPFSHEPVTVVVASALAERYFPTQNASLPWDEYEPGQKAIPFRKLSTVAGDALIGLRYEQLLSYAQPKDGDPFRIVGGDFVTTEDGTGIVHLAPSFGADDFRVGQQQNLGSLTLVDRQGRFASEIDDPIFPLKGRFVKDAYYTEAEKAADFEIQKVQLASVIRDLKQHLSADDLLVIKLQQEGKLFRKEKYEHSYPHCWRTDKPVLYYPLDSWFVRTTAVKERMVELNKTIQWKPESTGTGRFGNWLENLVDWNLSRSRYWGIPLPIWRTEDGKEERCIGSVEELRQALAEARAAGIDTPEDASDLHRPFVDDLILISPSGKPMKRELDLIDVWFDSGAMPYAQWHYPFEHAEDVEKGNVFPADFIAEGVDQTRGWFFTLHAIATMVFDQVAFKRVVSNGLVLDKFGNKMSKRLGNAVDPFVTLERYGPDATRWYMITNASPWDNLKFDEQGIVESQRGFFGTLHNTYAFFALYANIDGFTYKEASIPVPERPELDQWVLSELNSLIQRVSDAYNQYEPTRAGREMNHFVDHYLSNWYVRQSRRRFWKGEYTSDKVAAYQTLYTCLTVLSKLMAPIAPFYAERLFNDLNRVCALEKHASVHLTDFPVADEGSIQPDLERKMELAQNVCSLVFSIRKKENIRVRQPLNVLRIPIIQPSFQADLEAMREIICSEVNVKHLDLVSPDEVQLVKNLKLNFRTLGKRYGSAMKAIQNLALTQAQSIIQSLESEGVFRTIIEGVEVEIEPSDAEILPVDLPGWKVANQGSLTVALDVSISDDLRAEGLARELVNRIQKLRKDKGFAVTDRITVGVETASWVKKALEANLDYISAEILADHLYLGVQENQTQECVEVELEEGITALVSVEK
jgi:isoleucyl-tRNA synthetase